ncbi:cytochrome p450 [Diplodia corticola]|uniref:Cytochrome p450 n=1 Tax=Diplodia corticola TaxID=236234 RepID=A0A1J9QIN4_9PEZI|nr:cytochrome p450 [Diplodia corticola]OJD28710.1 cytochrome p450 [Diplodia corticola]
MRLLTAAAALAAQHPALVVCIVFVLYAAGLAVYRLFFHPLARFPGPKLAAATLWYEFFFDGVQCGQYTFEIGRMHEKYGPIVRISPNELHVNDPKFIDQLYVAGGKKRDKYEYFTTQFGIPQSVFSTVPHDLHRLRRGAMNRFFSKASVVKLEPLIKDTINKLCTQLETHYAGTGQPATLNMAYSCMTTDVVTEYAFARSYSFLDSPTFEPNFHRAIVAGSNMGPYTKRFPWLLAFMRCLPSALVSRLNPEMDVYLRFQEDVRKQIAEIQATRVEDRKSGRTGATIFHELIDGDLPDEEKRLERMWQEGQIIVGAGTETTAWSLSATMFYILWTPHVRTKLQAELDAAIPDATELPSLQVLQALPYLSAVVTEGLRLSYGVSTRLQRLAPEPLSFTTGSGPTGSDRRGGLTTHTIPANTPVGMSCPLVHLNPLLFPEPCEFRPERWLDAPPALAGCILSFSKGSRQCIGINLAYAELYYGIAGLVRRLGPRLQLFETDLSDVELLYDRFVPTPKLDTKGIRVLVQ